MLLAYPPCLRHRSRKFLPRAVVFGRNAALQAAFPSPPTFTSRARELLALCHFHQRVKKTLQARNFGLVGNAPETMKMWSTGVAAMVEAIVPRDWRMLYTAAMLESDSAQLQVGIAKAHAAMTARLMELPHGPSSSMERRELVSALKYLSCLEASLASE